MQDDQTRSVTPREETPAFKIMIALHPYYDVATGDYPDLPGVQVCSLGCQGRSVPDGHEGFVITMQDGKKYLVTVAPLED